VCLDLDVQLRAGFGSTKEWSKVLPHTDTVLLSIKAFNPHTYQTLAKSSNSMVGFVFCFCFVCVVSFLYLPLVVFGPPERRNKVLPHADPLLLSIKAFNPHTYQTLAKSSNAMVSFVFFSNRCMLINGRVEVLGQFTRNDT
jgi:pyruvate-formate lyase-activating enzyme